MKKIKFTLLSILITISFHAQKISGKILDENNNPISEARIGIENKEIGGITDSNGNYTIDLNNIDKTETFKVIASEYEPFKVSIADFVKSQNYIFQLKKKAIDLNAVIINPKKYVHKNFGTSNAKKAYFSIDSNDPDDIFIEHSIKISNKKKLKIKNININIVDSKFEKNAIFIFDIQNAKNGFPDDTQSLINETLKLTVSENDIKNKKLSLDISDKNIWTDKDFFISVRMAEDFKGKLSFGGNIFAFSKDTYYRNYLGEWKKYSGGEPSINVDVMIEK
ncbi:carboxypeptidase-like regulatory domain-containing protein [Flavobacterium aquicola]|uniref:Carboxypeptidase-like protein n=1 Tax=Flavobacterium aquicola TaxID=1682742 RepID=A0A3E0EIH1_9FLAO|nr:carboxypeptidase-like regulatory domain-containing protein [Flavobacterium aquicola]REG97955.1 carboxypeptidase-like protein [Flavobacterium aquicola]